MKVGKCIFYIFILLLIGACSTYSKNGVYYIENPKLINNECFKNTEYKSDFDCISLIDIKMINNKFIRLILPLENSHGIGGGYQLFSTLLPIPIKNDMFENNTRQFYISLSNIDYDVRKPNYKEQNQYFVDFKENAKITLIVNNKEYKSSIIYNYPNILYLSFPPLRIKDVKKGTLVIEYNGIKKEVEFEYGYKWFYYH